MQIEISKIERLLLIVVIKFLFNPLVPRVPFLYLLKTSRNFTSSDAFRGYRKGILDTNRLINY